MRVFLFGLALCSLLRPLQGQHFPLLEETLRIQFEVIDEGGQAVAGWSNISPEAPMVSSISVHNLSFIDAGLFITFSLEKTEKEFYYQINLSIQDEDGALAYPAAWSIKGEHQHIKKEFDGLELLWANALEEILDFNRPYTLLLTTRLFGDLAQLGVSCEKRPAFTYREQLPNYLGLATGLGLIGIGQVFKANADEDYQQYLTRWQDGNSTDEARPYLEAARSKDNTYKILAITGIAVLSVDAVGYGFRFFKYKKRVRQYEKYCPKDEAPGNKSPAWRLSARPGGAGVKIVARF
ncbi:MAG: hypothetical protein H6573_30335 [Lewinellaceae bacterium]|nr:hypothetical protein [Phaeodactylibacter sp.]MCB0612523.1 hypothetical protein [Phaeodactylibacter sp.]MCB9351758.1 hypothetical protein [Lewinellaceae bacterium]